MKLPIPTHDLDTYLPHRPPMVWVDTVESVTADGGECSLTIDFSRSYCGPDGIRPSAPIEWMAQAYGFVKAVQIATGVLDIIERPKVTFLAQVRNATSDLASVEDQSVCYVRVQLKRALGPLNLVTGTVFNSRRHLIASAELKLYAE